MASDGRPGPGACLQVRPAFRRRSHRRAASGAPPNRLPYGRVPTEPACGSTHPCLRQAPSVGRNPISSTSYVAGGAPTMSARMTGRRWDRLSPSVPLAEVRARPVTPGGIASAPSFRDRPAGGGVGCVRRGDCGGRGLPQRSSPRQDRHRRLSLAEQLTSTDMPGLGDGTSMTRADPERPAVLRPGVPLHLTATRGVPLAFDAYAVWIGIPPPEPARHRPRRAQPGFAGLCCS
jgi:hypothetical protein